MALTSILVVCTGNVCRSPSAEGFLRRELTARFATTAPTVASAGTMGWQGEPATAESVRATAERGVDIAAHRARQLTEHDLGTTDLVLTMTAEHTARVIALRPEAAANTFTLKELTRLLEDGDPSGSPEERIAAAASRRSERGTLDGDLDVADPLGEPLAVYRAMAEELEDWSRRLAAGLAPAHTEVPA